MYEGIDTIVLQNELAFEDELPFAWRSCALPLSAGLEARHVESNVRLLQICLTLDESTSADKAEDAQQNLDVARLDMKVNLLLDLVGKLLLQNHPRPLPGKLRLNARGAAWQARAESSDEALKIGETGMVEIYLHEYLLDPLRLAARVIHCEGGRVEVRFDRASDTVVDLIDKLTFRRHRRQVAVARQPRSAS